VGAAPVTGQTAPTDSAANKADTSGVATDLDASSGTLVASDIECAIFEVIPKSPASNNATCIKCNKPFAQHNPEKNVHHLYQFLSSLRLFIVPVLNIRVVMCLILSGKERPFPDYGEHDPQATGKNARSQTQFDES
jgi:hypothetical protein